MSSLSVSKLRADLADALNRVAYTKERLVIERQGKELAVLVPVEDLRWMEEMEDGLWGQLADRAMREPGEDTSLEQIKRELGLD